MNTTPRLSALEYLQSHGLDPSHILRDDFSSEGYWKIDTNSDGRPFKICDEFSTSWREWPDGFNYLTFLSMWESGRH